MTSKAQKNNGFPLPDVIEPPDFVCMKLDVPNDPAYIQAITGHIAQLGKWWNWQKSYEPGDVRAKKAAELWRKTIYETLTFGECENDMACCDDLIEEVAGIRSDLRRLAANKATSGYNRSEVVNHYNTYITNYNASTDPVTDLAPDLKTPSETVDLALCAAIDEFVDLACEIAIQSRTNLNIANDAVALGLAGIGALGAIGVITLGVGAVAALAFGAFVVAGNRLVSGITVAQLNDPAARDEVVCCMLSSLRGQEPTLQRFQNSLNACPDISPNAQAIAAALNEYADAGTEAHAGFLERLQIKFNEAELGLVGCPCEEEPVNVPGFVIYGQPGITSVVRSGNTYTVTGAYQAPSGSFFLRVDASIDGVKQGCHLAYTGMSWQNTTDGYFCNCAQCFFAYAPSDMPGGGISLAQAAAPQSFGNNIVLTFTTALPFQGIL